MYGTVAGRDGTEDMLSKTQSVGRGLLPIYLAVGGLGGLGLMGTIDRENVWRNLGMLRLPNRRRSFGGGCSRFILARKMGWAGPDQLGLTQQLGPDKVPPAGKAGTRP